MENRPLPQMSAEMKAQLKADRLNQYRTRIFNVEMDIVAYTAVGDAGRLELAKKNLDDFLLSYYAVEAME